jgi:lipopolysaccharide/colanic/teichoic acid biosynthesis glycosyltransferase
MAGARWWSAGGKRAFDLVVGTLLLVVTLPLTIACATLVRALDGSPVLFRQSRVGRGARPFEIVKFRTMRPAAGDLVTAADDPRITRLGRWLRRSKLDELPQLWNVIRGEMSLVGPRPEVPTFVRTQPHAYRALAHLRPGVTDWASLAFRDEETLLAARAADADFYLRSLLPRKLALARLYAWRVSLRIDLAILTATGCLLLGAGGLVPALVGRRLIQRARRRL